MKTYGFEYWSKSTNTIYTLEVKLTNGQRSYNDFLNWYSRTPYIRNLRKVK